MNKNLILEYVEENNFCPQVKLLQLMRRRLV